MILLSDLNFPERPPTHWRKPSQLAQEGQGEKGKAKITLMAGPILANKTGYDPK